jgi:hypothetical protein
VQILENLLKINLLKNNQTEALPGWSTRVALPRPRGKFRCVGGPSNALSQLPPQKGPHASYVWWALGCGGAHVFIAFCISFFLEWRGFTPDMTCGN